MTVSEEKLRYHLDSLAGGIRACLEKNLHLPTLILLYSAIETAGSLDNEVPNAGTRRIFETWVNKYLLTVRSLYCNAVDLWGARCGVLHTLTPYSDLSEKGQARKVLYAWGVGDADYLSQWIHQKGLQNEAVAVHFNDLLRGWEVGVETFLHDLQADPQRKAGVLQRAKLLFADILVDEDHNIIWEQSVP